MYLTDHRRNLFIFSEILENYKYAIQSRVFITILMCKLHMAKNRMAEAKLKCIAQQAKNVTTIDSKSISTFVKHNIDNQLHP